MKDRPLSRYFEFVPSLPKTPTEKVEKFTLADGSQTVGTGDCES